MKQITALVVLAALALASPAAFAGHYGKCTMTTQECLDTMAAKFQKKGVMGIELNEETMAITKVLEKSPAQEAGLQVGDVLFAVNGVQYAEENGEKLAKIREEMVPGKVITLTVLGQGKEKKDVEITLAKMSEEVMASWIGKHIVEHAALAQASEGKATEAAAEAKP